MPNRYADYYEMHESKESIRAPEHIPACELCHEDNATETVEDEGKEIKVCDYCAKQIIAFGEGRI
jgi:ribosome-binding protein aMBF1 (putative translation factor)